MNEISNDLNVITAEINSFKQVAGQAVFEIGGRLHYVKENDLAHGEWEKWCRTSLNFSLRNASRYIRVYERFSNRTPGADLGLKKMDMLTAFDDEELETPVALPSGEIKKPIDMSQAEIDKYKKQLKETESERIRLENLTIYQQQELNKERSKPQQVTVKEVQVIPEGMKKKVEELEFQNNNLRHGYQEAKEKIQKFELLNTIDFDAEQSRKQREKMQHEADYNTLELRVHITNFLEKVAISSFMQGAITASDPITKRKLQESITMLESFTTQIKAALNGRILGGIVNE